MDIYIQRERASGSESEKSEKKRGDTKWEKGRHRGDWKITRK